MVLVIVFLLQELLYKIEWWKGKNRTLVNIAKTMIIESNFPQSLWAKAVNTACHVTNRCLIRSVLNKTPYELLNNKKPTLSYLRGFGCKCFVLNNEKDDLRKFDPRSDERVFVGYSSSSKACKVFKKRTQCIEESIHVVFDEDGNLKRNASNDEDWVQVVSNGCQKCIFEWRSERGGIC